MKYLPYALGALAVWVGVRVYVGQKLDTGDAVNPLLVEIAYLGRIPSNIRTVEM